MIALAKYALPVGLDFVNCDCMVKLGITGAYAGASYLAARGVVKGFNEK